MSTVLSLLLLLLLLLLAFLGTMLMTYLTRGTVINRVQVLDEEPKIPEVTSQRFHLALKLLTEAPLFHGNKIELLLNGEGTYPRLWEDLRTARKVITIHVFYFHPGKLADQLRDILIERARKGVQVLVMFDAFGSWGLSQNYRQSLKTAGAEVAVFRPLRLKTLYKFQQRMHVRSIIIDARIGYTGGFGIDDRWLGDGRHPDQWRDTNIRLQGPAVNQLQAAFCANWAEATGNLLMGRDIFRLEEAAVAGTQEAGIMFCAPSLGSTHAERFLMLLFAAVRKSLYITNAYFVPDKDFRSLLMQAANRGVDVRVLTPGHNTDRPSAWYASRAHYEELIEAGIRIYEYRPAMVHAKSLIVDRLWTSVGSFNFDNRSIKLNDEVALIIRDEALAGQLEDIFFEDLAYAKEVTLQEMRQRARLDRVKEQASRLLAPLL